MSKYEFRNKPHRGGAPVGYLSELTNLERNAILFLRYWSQNSSIHEHLQNEFWSDLIKKLGLSKTSKAIDAFDDVFKLCIKYSRRSIMKHEIECKCVGGDESCFANIFGFASEGKQEDALLLASNLIAPKFAPYLVNSAVKFAKSFSYLDKEQQGFQSEQIH